VPLVPSGWRQTTDSADWSRTGSGRIRTPSTSANIAVAAVADEGGSYVPNPSIMATARGYFPKVYPRLIEILQLLGSSGLMATPIDALPRIGERIEITEGHEWRGECECGRKLSECTEVFDGCCSVECRALSLIWEHDEQQDQSPRGVSWCVEMIERSFARARERANGGA
jgi:hypothetical protein